MPRVTVDDRKRTKADAVTAAAEPIKLSERDSLRVLALLERPLAPNEKLRAAAAALPKAL